MAVSVAVHGHGPDDHGGHDDDIIYQETRDMRLMGFVLFLVSNVVLVSSYIFAYISLRNSIQPPWPPIVDGHQLPRLDTAFAAFNSVVLFGSGVTMHFALESWKHANKPRFNTFMWLTIFLGLGFLGGQGYEYAHAQIGGWSGNIFGASVFTLTGVHGVHALLGVCFPFALWIQTQAGGYTEHRFFGLTAGTLYWHFVDVIWVVLFFLFYLW